MKVDRKSFLMRVGYTTLSSDVPNRISLCDLFWRIVIGLLFYCLNFMLFVFVIGSLAFLFDARRPVLRCVLKENKDFSDCYVPITRWPLKYRGRNIPPMVIFVSGVLLFLLCVLVFMMCRDFLFFLDGCKTIASDVRLWATSSYGIVSIASASLLGFGVWFLKKIARTDAWRIFWAYVKAKKDRVCPIVEIV